jgi:hypothetical protein
MHGWLSIIVIILAGLTALYVLKMEGLQQVNPIGWEGFVSGSGDRGLEGETPEQPLAAVDQGLPLADMIAVQTKLSGLDARGCADIDRPRSMELGGQYVQRTNNYKRDYPDNCSAPLSELVGAIYKPADGVGLTVPCAGQC